MKRVAEYVLITIAVEVAALGWMIAHPSVSAVTPVVKPTVMSQVPMNAIAKELFTPKQYDCLMKVIWIESRNNPKAKNPHSSARGIGQLLTETYRNLGMKHSSDSRAQLVALIAYIGRHYSGGPCTALAHEHRYNYI